MYAKKKFGSHRYKSVWQSGVGWSLIILGVALALALGNYLFSMGQ